MITLTELTLEQRLRAIATPIAKGHIKTLNNCDYIEWPTARAILDFWLEGLWSNQIDRIEYHNLFPVPLSQFKPSTTKSLSPGNQQETGVAWQQEIIVVTTLSVIINGDVVVQHAGLGNDLTLEHTNAGWHYNEKGATSAESHAFKRAASKFGIGAELYTDRRDTVTEGLTLRWPAWHKINSCIDLIINLLDTHKIDDNNARETLAFLRSSPSLDAVEKTYTGLLSRTGAKNE